MQVRVLYLGMLKDILGREKEDVQLAESARLGELFAELQRRSPELGKFAKTIALAVNYEYSGAATVLHENDEVALLPPVSGGLSQTEPSTAENTLPLLSPHARIVREPIKAASILTSIKQPADGAVVAFDGIVRNNSRGRPTLHLEYTAYDRMALRQMELLAQEALSKFAVRDARLVHRLGRLQIGDSSVYVAVSAEHRAAAFDACRWLIDKLKTTVPIWKKEFFEDGAVWADGEAFPTEVPRAGQGASK